MVQKDTGVQPIALLVDGRYADYEVERHAIEDAGGALLLPPGVPLTEADVLALEGLDSALVLLVELAPITRAVLERATSCVAVIRYGTGLDNIDLEAAGHFGVTAENVAGYAGEAVSEHAMALLLAVSRRLIEQVDRIRDGGWRDGDVAMRPIGLSGRTLGIVGMGAIGKSLAARARPFGMTVLGYDPFAPDPGFDLAEMLPLHEVISRSDFLSLHSPLLPETQGMMNHDTLSAMPRGAVLINTSRGGLVDEEALIQALDDGRVSYAALDVMSSEPPPIDHPFRTHPKVVLTPHVGFWSDQAEVALRTAVAVKAARHISAKRRDRHEDR